MTLETKKKKKTLKQKIGITVASVVGISIIATGGYFISKNLKQEVVPDGSSQTLFRGMIESFVSGSGRTIAKDHEELGKKLKGDVLEVFVKTGDTVAVGDLLLSVNPEKIREDLNGALDIYDQKLLAVNTTQEKIDGLNITAPFTGKVIKIAEENEGSTVSEGLVYATIADDSTMKLSTYFSYGYIENIKVGQKATVSIPATTSNIEGTVSVVEQVKKISTDGTILFKVVIDIKNSGTLTADMVASATVATDVGDVMPAESGLLEYNKIQDIVLKTSGELISKNVNEHYIYNAGDSLGKIKNTSLNNDLTSALRDLEAAQKTVDEANALLATTELRSPIAGLVSQISVSVGDELTGESTTAPISISNLETLKIDARISEIDITKVSMGMPVTIEYESTDGYFNLMGEITALSLEAEQSNDGNSFMSYFPATVTIQDPQQLRPDMNVQYRISASIVEDALLAPVSAVVQTDIGPSLYIKAEYAEGLETFPIIDETIPEGYVAVSVDVGISDGFNSEILTVLPDNTEIYVPNSEIMPGGGDMGGMGGMVTEQVYIG